MIDDSYDDEEPIAHDCQEFCWHCNEETWGTALICVGEEEIFTCWTCRQDTRLIWANDEDD